MLFDRWRIRRLVETDYANSDNLLHAGWRVLRVSLHGVFAFAIWMAVFYHSYFCRVAVNLAPW